MTRTFVKRLNRVHRRHNPVPQVTPGSTLHSKSGPDGWDGGLTSVVNNSLNDTSSD